VDLPYDGLRDDDDDGGDDDDGRTTINIWGMRNIFKLRKGPHAWIKKV
jgi:hypothetical protein